MKRPTAPKLPSMPWGLGSNQSRALGKEAHLASRLSLHLEGWFENPALSDPAPCFVTVRCRTFVKIREQIVQGEESETTCFILACSPRLLREPRHQDAAA